MSGETDLIKLYSGRILALAADIPHAQRLETADASVKKRSPLCGSAVTVDVSMTDGCVSAFGQDVKACALGQAAASVVGDAIIGCTYEQAESARNQLRALLKGSGEIPTVPQKGQ
jgi:NifU-like protein involved in Fe-S cluster formation